MSGRPDLQGTRVRTWPRSKPLYRGTARTAVLYCDAGGWRFAIYGESGIVDVPVHALGEAHARVLAAVEQLMGKPCVATWAKSKADWWTGDLAQA
jgi:hypothetical protein